VALVLESFFRRSAPPAPDARADEAPAVAAAPAVPSAAAATATTTTTTTLGWGPAVDLLGAWALGPSSPALAFDLWYAGRPPSAWAFGVEGVWHFSEQHLTEEFEGVAATATLRSTLLRGWVARRLRVATPLELLLGPELVLGVDRMSTSGFPDGASNVRASAGGGGRAHLRLRLASRATLSLVAAVDYTPHALAARFEVDNVPGEFFPAPQVRAFIGAGVGIALFP
jgi:hypothetical protein